MLERLNAERKKGGLARLTLQDVHEETGIHRKILSRIVNRAHENTSSEHPEKLVQYFFKILRKPD